MNGTARLELGYRRWLHWYPRWFRREHEDEMLAVLLAAAPPGLDALRVMDRLDLVRGGLGTRLRPRIPHSDRAAHLAVRLMVAGAVTEAGVAVFIWASAARVRASIAARHPGYSAGAWHAEVAGRLAPLAIGAAAFTAVWLWLAWASGRRRRSARIGCALLLVITTLSLLHGLAQGSATYARMDLAAGLVLWAVELSAVAALTYSALRRLASGRTQPAPLLSPSATSSEELSLWRPSRCPVRTSQPRRWPTRCGRASAPGITCAPALTGTASPGG